MRRPSAFVRVVVAVVASVALMSADHRASHLESIRSLLSTVLYPLQLAVHFPVRAGEWLSDRISTRWTTQVENNRLREELLLQQVRLERFDELEAENRRLRTLLGSSERIGERVLVAELMAVSMDPFSRRVVLDKGARDSVSPGQPLIDSSGIIGQIIHTGPFTSNALLITDPSHALPVQIQRNGLRAVAHGTGPLNLLKITHLPHSTDVRIDDRIVASGLGNRFPSGYPVGKVVEIRRDEGRPFVEIHVQPSAMLERAREVLLVRSDAIIDRESVSGTHTLWSGW